MVLPILLSSGYQGLFSWGRRLKQKLWTMIPLLQFMLQSSFCGSVSIFTIVVRGLVTGEFHLYLDCGYVWRMPSSGMLCHVALVRTDVSEERSTSIIMVTRIGELGKTLPVTSNLCMLWRNTIHLHSSETSVLMRATWCNILEDDILHSHHCENLKSYL
jgi:hypothetical protein